MHQNSRKGDHGFWSQRPVIKFHLSSFLTTDNFFEPQLPMCEMTAVLPPLLLWTELYFPQIHMFTS